MKKYRLAFAGFRHPHIMSLWERVQTHPECEIVAAWEGDPDTARQLQSKGIQLTHGDYIQMLKETNATVVAIGDVYARRGALAISALEAGKNILSDKPICTKLEEWEKISRLARQRGLAVGCQLDLVESPALRVLKELIQAGRLGRLCTIAIGAQHPLRLASRAPWYFEPGQQGGTINDIGVHVFDLIPWLSGKSWETLISAREWNAKAEEFPHFKDGAQLHGILQDGLTCFADLSYLAPDRLGYDLPLYWRITVHGTKGVAETSYGASRICLVLDESETSEDIFAEAMSSAGGYLEDFLHELAARPRAGSLTTERVLNASRWALEAQLHAETSLHGRKV